MLCEQSNKSFIASLTAASRCRLDVPFHSPETSVLEMASSES